MMEKRMVKREIGAYFTVEAAMIMPVVFAVVFLVMYLMFFRYNRALMDQEAGRLLVKGAAMQMVTEEERVTRLKMEEEQTPDRYVLWEKDPFSIRVETGRIIIRGEGSLHYPFAGWMLEDIPQVWETGVERGNEIQDPVFWTRLRRKTQLSES